MIQGVFSQHKAKERARDAAAQQELLGAKAIETADTESARRLSAESARFNVQGMLGAPGTYDYSGAPGSAAATSGDSSSIYFQDTGAKRDRNLAKKSNFASGLFKYADEDSQAGKAISKGAREGIIDPDAYASSVGQSAEFMIRSKLTAE